MKAKKGDWVQIRQTILNPSDRAPQVPDDTKLVPLQLWVKGTAQDDASIGDNIDIITMTGRRVNGELVDINPKYIHSFGEFVPELLKIDMQLKEILFGGEKNE